MKHILFLLITFMSYSQEVVVFSGDSHQNQNFSLGMVSRFDTINMFDNRLNFENIYNSWIDQFEFKYLFDIKSKYHD